jgi:GTP-binding protein
VTITVAIIGRPNVGKSTLFNRLAGRKLALVDDLPGLTRDRKEVAIKLNGHAVTLTDTAGIEDAEAGSIPARMREQTEFAIADASVLLFVIDGRAGPTGGDRTIADMVRASGKPFVLAANKCESRASDAGYYETYELGLGEPVPISAEHNLGIGDLIAEVLDRIEALEPLGDDRDGDGAKTRPLKIAIAGRPNAGKSTLANALLGEERMMTGPEAGLTRDAIAASFDWKGRPIRLFDTAGLRRKARIVERAETLAVGDALRAIKFAEIVILLLDVENPFEKQDLTLADLVEREGRGLVFAVNKWDLVENPQSRLSHLRKEAERLLPKLVGTPLVAVSALSGRGLDKLMEAVLAVETAWNTRVPTSALNRWFAEALERHAPPAVSGRRIKLRYITQASTRPPTFVMFSSRPEALPDAYTRYLVNDLKKTFKLAASPVRLHVRKTKNPYDSGEGGG